MKFALARLKRRLQEIESYGFIQPNSDHDLLGLYHKIVDTLVGAFGENTVEYKRYDPGSPAQRLQKSGRSPASYHEKFSELTTWLATTKRNLKVAIDLLEEQIADISAHPEAVSRTFEGLTVQLHPQILAAAEMAFRGGLYAHAVEDSVKALRDLVRSRSKRADLDGTNLMKTVFSPRNPILQFNEFKNESDRNEQEGFMMLFTGAVVGLRNPRAHDFIEDDPERALEFIGFVSLLAKLLDSAVHKDESQGAKGT